MKQAGIIATIPGFEKFMITSKERGLTYAVFKGKKYRADDLGFPVMEKLSALSLLSLVVKRQVFFKLFLGQLLLRPCMPLDFSGLGVNVYEVAAP
jgi:hypothetical protein